MMSAFETRNPDFEARIRDSFVRQSFTATIGAELTRVAEGETEIRVPYRADLCQQHGLFHGGLIGTIADNCCGYAAFTLMAASDSVLTVEYKVNIMSPAQGEALVARARVVRPGRRITVCQGDVFAVRDGAEKLCATALGTFAVLENTSDHSLDGKAA
jgi:uncharacterized protein (TIGR00369 family)